MNNKNVLIINNYPVLPVFNGACKVIFEYCKLLKKCGCRLSFCITSDAIISEEMKFFFEDRIYIYRRPFIKKISPFNIYNKIHNKIPKKYNGIDDLFPFGFDDYVEELHKKNNYDICIVNYITLSKVLKKSTINKKAIYTHDAFTYKTELLNLKKFWFNLKPNEEAKGIRRATDIISIQENESSLFHYYSPHANLYTVYSSFSINKQSLLYNDNILFIAGKNEVNYNGIIFFIENVFPKVIEKHPNSKLLIAGQICDLLQQYSSCNYVDLKGKVDNIDAFYALGDIVINPVYQGTGLKVKTFEALSYGKITIVHEHSTDGIFKKENAPLLVAENAERYAILVNEILDCKEMRDKFHEQSITYMEDLNNYVYMQYYNLINS